MARRRGQNKQQTQAHEEQREVQQPLAKGVRLADFGHEIRSPDVQETAGSEGNQPRDVEVLGREVSQ